MSQIETAAKTLADNMQAFFVKLQADVDAMTQAKGNLALLNKSELKAMKLTTGDIKNLPEVWLDGRSYPLYRLSDVDSYIEEKTTRKNVN